MRVLAADKEPAVLELIEARLRSRKYDVVVTRKSDEVLRFLRGDRFDLVMISTEMERVGGRLLIQKIREQQHLNTMPIMMLTSEDEISELILSHERGFDDFLIKPFSPLVLQLRAALNISRTRVRSQANALTQLPGNAAIEEKIRERIASGEKFSVLYIDLNQFKAFNDHYGFAKGDDVILQTAKLLMQTKDAVCPGRDCFIGHIGGDDFVVVLTPDSEETYAKHFIAELDRIMPTYYNEEDRRRGYIEVLNRRGERERFPMVSCAVAACTNLTREYQNIGAISHDASELKSFLKAQPGSQYLRDRREAPIEGLDQAAHVLSQPAKKRDKKGRLDPLGKTLLDAGLINEEQLERAVKRHMLTGQRLGQTLIAMNLVQSEDVGRMLQKKLNVPYVSLKQFMPSRDILRLFTFEFMRTKRVVPLEIVGDRLRLAMCDPFDIKTLDAIEQISEYKPIPLLALEDEFEYFIEKMTAGRSTGEPLAS